MHFKMTKWRACVCVCACMHAYVLCNKDTLNRLDSITSRNKADPGIVFSEMLCLGGKDMCEVR